MKPESGWHRESRRLAESIGWRSCAKCGERKRSDSFYPPEGAKQGLSPNCKSCEGYYRAAGLSRPK
jgi:hypothetical protein